VNNTALEARQFVRGHHHGVLATNSKRLAGAPFASVCPFITDHQARPVFLISGLAEHTKNLAADPRASLIVHPCADNMHAAGRVTLTGQAENIGRPPALVERCTRLLPEAAGYFDLGDFNLWHIHIEAIRFIVGFGKIEWVEPAGYAPPENTLEEWEASILAHMNQDHAASLVRYVEQATGKRPAEASMTGIDTDGMNLRTADGNVRIDFPRTIADSDSARRLLIELAQ
jgi:heme iron utilization protein